MTEMMEITVEVLDDAWDEFRIKTPVEIGRRLDDLRQLVQRQHHPVLSTDEPAAELPDALGNDPIERLEAEFAQESLEHKFKSAEEFQQGVAAKLCTQEDCEYSREEIRALAAWLQGLYLRGAEMAEEEPRVSKFLRLPARLSVGLLKLLLM